MAVWFSLYSIVKFQDRGAMGRSFLTGPAPVAHTKESEEMVGLPHGVRLKWIPTTQP